jgi:hypothetical protein
MTLTSGRIDTHNIPCVLVANSSGGGVAGALDANYYKGQGLRQGIEREFVVVAHGNTGIRCRPCDAERKPRGCDIHVECQGIQGSNDCLPAKTP